MAKMQFGTRCTIGALAACFMGVGAQVHADDTLLSFLKQTSISGNVRAYDFNRIYSHDTQSAQPSQSALSLGGRFDAQTAEFLGGFSIGAGFVTAHSLGFNDRDGNLIHLDQTLAGSHSSLTALSQAYLRYSNAWINIKAGDQNINTPWLSDSDSRLLPSTYQGITVDVTPIEHLHLIGLRVFRWKSRTSSDYFQNNLYYAATYSGDDLRGGANTGLTGTDTQGTLAFGTTFADHGLKINLWYYNFEQFANMVYNDTVYTLKTGSGFDPFVGDQYVREWKSNSMLDGASVNTIKGQGVDNVMTGAKAGVNTPYGQLMFSYADITDHRGSVGNGALISPYTVGYTTDPLDTSSMIRGMVDLGPGHALKVRYSDKFFSDQLVLITAFARYHSYTYGGSNNLLLDLAYYPADFVKGLSIRNRAEDAVVSNPASGLNPGKAKVFFYDRVQLQYEF